MEKKIAVCLLSGGLDSCVAAAIAKEQGYSLYMLSLRYGQKLVKEVTAAKKIAKLLEAKEHKIIDLSGFKEVSISPITGQIPIPTNYGPDTQLSGVPLNYPPGRDPMALISACAWAESLWLSNPEVLEAVDVFIGTNSFDSKRYPDCSKEYYHRFNGLLEVGTKMAMDYKKQIKIVTPLINMEKVDVIREGIRLNAPIDKSWSCYKGGRKPCGKCTACRVREDAYNKLKEK